MVCPNPKMLGQTNMKTSLTNIHMNYDIHTRLKAIYKTCICSYYKKHSKFFPKLLLILICVSTCFCTEVNVKDPSGGLSSVQDFQGKSMDFPDL